MLEQRLNQRFVLMMTLIIIAAIFALFVIWTIVSQVSIAPVITISTIPNQTAPVLEVIDPVETANYLKLNQQVVGLTSNWNTYQASLNYADYSTRSLLYNPVMEYSVGTPLVSYTSSLEYNLPMQHKYTVDTPLVSYTASVNR